MNREQFFGLISPNRSSVELQLIQHAYWIAKEGHRTQTRDGGMRYFQHPRDVALTLVKFGYTETPLIVTGLLHDIPEDTYVPPTMLVQLFGGSIWQWLNLLSKQIPSADPVTGFITGRSKKPTEEYFRALQSAAPEVQIIKCCDRHDNLLTAEGHEPPRRRRYIDETNNIILPMARQHCPNVARAMEPLVVQLEASLQNEHLSTTERGRVV